MKSRLREITSCFRVLFHTSGRAHIVRCYTKSRRYVGEVNNEESAILVYQRNPVGV